MNLERAVMSHRHPVRLTVEMERAHCYPEALPTRVKSILAIVVENGEGRNGRGLL